jgi:hypothetical protein
MTAVERIEMFSNKKSRFNLGEQPRV